ncbi:MAG: hypothetical protein WDN00_02795 [Limisphaerales bacterium]
MQSVASGSAFNLALNASGTATGWGANTLGQTTLPYDLTNVTALAGGNAFGLALGNLPVLASNLVTTGFVDHDLLLTLPVSNPDANPLTYRIVDLPLAGQLYQSVAGNRGALINAPDTVVSDPTGQMIFAPDQGVNGSPYASFNFSVDDGLFAPSLGQVTVNIGLPAVPQFTALSWNTSTPGAESFNLNFTGSLDATYKVWASTNLTDWELLGTASPQLLAQYQFIDSGATNWSQRFYRISAGQ